MQRCRDALWDMVAPKESSGEASESGASSRKRKSESDMAKDQQCHDATEKYSKKVLTTEQLRDLKDNMYRKKVLTTKQLHDLKDRIQHDKIQDR